MNDKRTESRYVPPAQSRTAEPKPAQVDNSEEAKKLASLQLTSQEREEKKARRENGY